jgi:hypothetical protein
MEPSLLSEARRVLDLARRDRRAAEAALAGLPLEAQAAAVCEAPPAQRAGILELTPQPEQVIPLLPEAELCFTVKALGLSDASWILEHATRDQVVAGVDLDCWQQLLPDLKALDEWLTALSQAGDDALLRAAQGIDPELIVLHLRDRVDVVVKPGGEEAQGWQAPEGAHTLEGQFYLVPRREGDDLAPLLQMLNVLFRKDYWLYFRMLQGAVWELESDLAEWALRWRTGRLEDLGFPSWDEAMRIYGYVRPGQRGRLPEEPAALQVDEWALPVWMPQLPAGSETGPSLFRAVRDLRPEERHAFFYAFVALANKVAVADHLPLGDADTLPRAIEKAAAIASRGLECVAAENDLPLADVLRRATLTRLFQVGASLAREQP